MGGMNKAARYRNGVLGWKKKNVRKGGKRKNDDPMNKWRLCKIRKVIGIAKALKLG